MGQMTVWFKDRDVAFPREGEAQYGAILPQVKAWNLFIYLP